MARQPKQDGITNKEAKVLHAKLCKKMQGIALDEPQNFEAGSPEKVALLCLRWQAGVPLWQDGELQHAGDPPRVDIRKFVMRMGKTTTYDNEECYGAETID